MSEKSTPRSRLKKYQYIESKKEDAREAESVLASVVSPTRRLLRFTPRELAAFFFTPFIISVVVCFFLLSIFTSREQGVGLSISSLFQFQPFSFSNPFHIGQASSASRDIYDPYQLILHFEEPNYALIDLRSAPEFEREHIRGAVNIPVYETSADLKSLEINKNDFLNAVNNQASSKEEYIIYGNTRDSFYVQDALRLLQGSGKKAYMLGVGWNEFRHFKNLWLPESEWDTFDLNMYLGGKLQEEN